MGANQTIVRKPTGIRQKPHSKHGIAGPSRIFRIRLKLAKVQFGSGEKATVIQITLPVSQWHATYNRSQSLALRNRRVISLNFGLILLRSVASVWFPNEMESLTGQFSHPVGAGHLCAVVRVVRPDRHRHRRRVARRGFQRVGPSSVPGRQTVAMPPRPKSSSVQPAGGSNDWARHPCSYPAFGGLGDRDIPRPRELQNCVRVADMLGDTVS
jgi:hypothetical protein